MKLESDLAPSIANRTPSLQNSWMGGGVSQQETLPVLQVGRLAAFYQRLEILETSFQVVGVHALDN